MITESNTGGLAATLAPISPEVLAEQSDNPRFWLFKYSFYLHELEFSEKDAIRWANRSVHIDSVVQEGLKFLSHEKD